jgi:DNA-binding CsgD family transcriptional regulator
MNFNYRDFFIHNDDLHIIKEQLSINDAWVIKQDALSTNAKAVWDMYAKGGELDNEKIAANLGINVDTVKKIIDICEKKFLENKTIKQIADEMNFNRDTIHAILNKAIPDWERYFDANFTKDAEEIYNLHKKGKSPEEIVKLINQNRKSYLQIKLDKVNLVLKIVDIAKKQMENDGITNSLEIERQINGAKNDMAIVRLIKKLGIGKIRYTHKFTPEQDAFILSNYLQRICQSESARQFNTKFSTDSNKLNIDPSPIRRHLIKTILKSKSESEISEYALELLKIYKDTYFQSVNIEHPETKKLLKNYIPPETVGGRDRTGTGTNRDMSAHLGTLPKNFNTMLPPYYKS